MLGSRRPREVYRVYSEDDLLEDAEPAARSDTQEHDPAAHVSEHAPAAAQAHNPLSAGDGGEWVGDWPRYDYGGGSRWGSGRKRRLMTGVLAAAAGLVVGLGAVTLIERALTARRAAVAQPVAGAGAVAAPSPQAGRLRRSRSQPALSRATPTRRTRTAGGQRRRSAAAVDAAPEGYAVAYDPTAFGPAPVAAATSPSEQPGFGADEADAEFGFER